MKRAFLPALLIFLASGPFIAKDTPAQDKKGKVIEVRDGKLERHEKDWKEIRKGDDVYAGDKLRTGKNAVAIFKLPEVGKYVMGPDTEIELGKDRKAEMKRGAVWLNAKFPKGNTGGISTSLATAGVRGTKFSVFYGRGTKDVCVCTCSGSVEAELKNGKTVQVPAGTILAIKGDAPLPGKAEPAMPILEKAGVGFDFCFNCHVVGGRGKLKNSVR
ncbi:MAG TPA: FecR domain-containing protein [Thermodesulfobacteriota bacterium]|nr:FecR domain-containing protein [Thermodesulfobacteriota bacterium]